jgi:hypothetical protein
MNIPRTERYFLAPNLDTIQKEYNKTKDELIAHYKNQNTYKAGIDTDESINSQIASVMEDMYGDVNFTDRLSVKVNYFAVVEARYTIKEREESSVDYNYEFTIYSPWDSLKNAINQVTEFMNNKKWHCEWEILEIRRLYTIDKYDSL